MIRIYTLDVDQLVLTAEGVMFFAEQMIRELQDKVANELGDVE